jgi:Carboxypeptidase regulatory-like domain/TonB dependent receptor
MPKLRLRHAFVAVLLLVAMLAQVTWALAGTTGGISGTLTDTTTGKAVPDAKVTASSPSQTVSTTTDAGGHFSFLNLAPDTYTLSAEKDQFTPATVGGVTVFADQNVTVALQTSPQLKTIAKITSRAAGNLVKPGTTADVYSVNAATQQVVSGSGGGFNLNSAYSGVYAQPGVTSYIGNYGWGQVFYIRGSSYNQIGYEFDGVPVNRAFDNYQANSLSSLGQQELQVYTGGSPSGASSATLGGFINQVIKTGSYPGFGALQGGIGTPGFYHSLTAEAGGASPNRNFSYYVGLQGYNQHFPFGTWNNLDGIAPNGQSSYGFTAAPEIATVFGGLQGFYGNAPDGGAWAGQFTNGPIGACQQNGANAGIATGFTAANPGPLNGTCMGYGPFTAQTNFLAYLSDIYERDNVINVHFGIPHRNDSGRDDVQLLWDNSMQYQNYDSSINGNGGLQTLNNFMAPFAPLDTQGSAFPGLCAAIANLSAFAGCASQNSPIPYADSLIFAPGTSFGQPASTAKQAPYYFPNSATNRPLNTPGSIPVSGLETNLRDAFWNDVNIEKLQYTKNIGTNAYVRLFGYLFYSDWLISEPVCGSTLFLSGFYSTGMCGGQGTGNYELTTHTRGVELQFADQLNPQNLLRFTGNFTTAGVTRFNNSTWEAGYVGSRSGVTNLTTGNANNPQCFDYRPTVIDPATGNPVPNPNQGNQASCFSSSTYGTPQNPLRGSAGDPCAEGLIPATAPACVAGAKWLVTVPGGQGTYNTVRPNFTSLALEDEFRPTSKLDFNIGVRWEEYQYNLTNSNNAEFNFWFNEGAQVNCYDPGTGLPLLTPLAPGQPTPPNVVQTAPLANCNGPTGAPSPSGQQAVHPTGGTAPCINAGVNPAFCGPLLYSGNGVSQLTHTEWSPRIGGTVTLNPDAVIRFSAGRYTQPTETAFEQYLDQSGKRAAAFNFSQFWGLGFTTPVHDNPVQYSNNFDLSFEYHFKNTDWTTKISPFYRDTHNQIVSLVLGPNFVSGVNVGHQHSWGLEFQIAKGDPTRDGISGAISYTWTRAILQYGSLPNGTNGIDYLNNYIKAFNCLTSAGSSNPANGCTGTIPPAAACYQNGAADPTCADIDGTGAATVVANPYFNSPAQKLLDRNGYYLTYPNEPPNDPLDQGGTFTAISPDAISAWIQYKHGKLSVAPNFQLLGGSYYGSPTDTYGVDPRSCAQNQGAATQGGANAGAPVLPAGSPFALNPDYLTCAASPFVQSGFLAIPNPYTGHMDGFGEFQEPWQFNLGMLIRYDISPKLTATVTLTNIYNTCFGGNGSAWQSRFGPGTYTCSYLQNNFNYVGPTQGQPGFGGGFFYGANGLDAANGGQPYAPANNYPYAPYSGALPFQAYFQLQVKL